MKYKIILIIIFLAFIKKSNAQWFLATNEFTGIGDRSYAIDACDSNTVVFSTSSAEYSIPSKVFITRNGGKTWKNISPFKISVVALEYISICDSLHIWGITSKGQIYATSDGGENWKVQFSDTTKTKFMNYIKMFDLNNGIAMGDALNPQNDPAVFLKTTDGGNTWVSMNDSAFGGYSSKGRIDFINPSVGYFFALGLNSEQLYKTIDGASHWKKTEFNGLVEVLKFYNKDIGLVKDNLGKIQRTFDGGLTWQQFNNVPVAYGTDFEFLPDDPSSVWYLSSGLFFSNDTGRTWIKQEIIDSNLITRDIVFPDDQHGWILCDNGKLFYTNNNGGMITEVKNEKPKSLPREFRLEQNYPNPFNPTTTIKYSIPTVKEQNFTNVQIKVYDILGKEISTCKRRKTTRKLQS